MKINKIFIILFVFFITSCSQHIHEGIVVDKRYSPGYWVQEINQIYQSQGILVFDNVWREPVYELLIKGEIGYQNFLEWKEINLQLYLRTTVGMYYKENS